MTPYAHQEELSDVALEVLRANGMVYLAMEERTGKTLTSILAVEKSQAETCLVVTKKKAKDDWEKTLKMFKHTKDYSVINYHQVLKMDKPDAYDVVILDEAHNYITAFPK